MIQVERISKRFIGQVVLSNIKMTVKKGHSLVILGQSGSGKSVLLKLLAGLIEPDEGFIRLRSENVGMLFQKNALFDSFTVYDNLDFPLRERTSLSRDERHQRILESLSKVELSNTEHLFPHELSGGMQKRLGVARALIVEPEIVLYDEPTAGLDPITSKKIAQLIHRFQKEKNLTMVVVTSDVFRAFQLADQIGLLVPDQEQGSSLLMAGTPEEARRSEQPEVFQFLRGLLDGPLGSFQGGSKAPGSRTLHQICAELDDDLF